MNPKPTYKTLANLVGARNRCKATNNAEWLEKHTERIHALMENAPHGSGFDNGSPIDLSESTEEKLVFRTSFHHMDENGMYDGWTQHTVTIRPSLAFNYKMTISGSDRNGIKELIHQEFEFWLSDPAREATLTPAESASV